MPDQSPANVKLVQPIEEDVPEDRVSYEDHDKCVLDRMLRGSFVAWRTSFRVLATSPG